MYRKFRSFLGCRRASIPMMTALLLVPMVVITGGSVDFINRELVHNRLQDRLDGAVLAASSLKQKIPPEEVVIEFMEGFVDTSEPTLVIDADVDETNKKRVSATISTSVDTGFLGLIGLETLPIEISSAALQQSKNLEISLLLDMSGSMRWGTTNAMPSNPQESRFELLKDAAQDFVDDMLADGRHEFTTISIIPYAGHVNIGREIMYGMTNHRERFAGDRYYCVELEQAAFSKGFNGFTGERVPHFTNSNGELREKEREVGTREPWCPGEINAITLHSNNATYLKKRIEDYLMFDGTGTHIAMALGFKALDQSARPLIQALRTTRGEPTKPFPDRPAQFKENDPATMADDKTIKTIVLMTDGAISAQFRPKKPYDNTIQAKPSNETRETEQLTNQRLHATCKAARDENVLVFAIAFLISDPDAEKLRPCATIGNFYHVKDLDVASAFNSIATTLHRLKLVQ